jgi:integrase
MVLILSEAIVPRSLAGPILVDAHGIPRYWAFIWSFLDGAGAAQSYLKRQLSAIGLLYLAAEKRTGSDCLDKILTAGDVKALEPLLEGLFIELGNRSRIEGYSSNENWVSIFTFVQQVLKRGAQTKAGHQLNRILAKLDRLDSLYRQLTPNRNFQEVDIRALPAAVVEDLYELVDPSSTRNPFRSEDNAYRNFALFLLLLHQGIRRSEGCGLPVDAIQDGFDHVIGEVRNWMNIRKRPPGVVDTRSTPAELKTPESIRQIPIGRELVAVLDHYIANYRGKPEHPFLFSSQQQLPLSLPMVNAIFQSLSARLSPAAKRELANRRNKTTVSPHDLRHTAAVFRLSEFIEAGDSMEVAIGKLRTFFGWSMRSRMPLHYSRAFFEHRLATVWNSRFDADMNQLRKIGT